MYVELLIYAATVTSSCIMGYITARKGVYHGIYDAWGAIFNDLTDPNTQIELKKLGSNIAQGALKAGVSGAMPKFKLTDVIGMVAMKYLAGGDLSTLLSPQGQTSPAGEGNTNKPRPLQNTY